MKTLFTTNVLILFITFGIAMVSTNAIAQPANDLIENAIDLAYGPIPYEGEDVDFDGATIMNDATPAMGCEVTIAGIWYKFTATKNGVISAAISNPIDPVIIFFEGPATGVESGMELTYVDQASNPCLQSSLSSIEAAVGTTYYLYMRNLIDSNIDIYAEDIFQAPANDLIENAIEVGPEPFVDADVHFIASTNTNDGGQTNCNSSDTPGIWYKVTAEQDGQIDAQIDIDSIVVFYSAENDQATSGSDLTWVNQQTNPCGSGSAATIDAVAGTTYYIFAVSIADAFATVTIDAGQVLGSGENTIEGFDFYPNPVTNELNLSAKSTIDEVVVYNLMGQKVFSEKPKAAKTSIDLGHLSTGLYVMNITSGGFSGSYKIVKK